MDDKKMEKPEGRKLRKNYLNLTISSSALSYFSKYMEYVSNCRLISKKKK